MAHRLPTNDTYLARKLMVLQVVTLLIVGLPACSFLPKDLNPTPTPLMLAQVAASIAVAIEDHYEDPVCDAVETSAIEQVADLLNWPMTFLWQVIAFEGSVGWTVADALAGNPLRPEARFESILSWLPTRSAGVPPSLDGKSPTVPPACSRA